mgnify:CR=1 FL=1
MQKHNQALKIIGIILLAVILLGSLVGTIFYFAKQTGFGDTAFESQLKQEYTTLYADNTDIQFILLNNEEYCPDSSSRTNNAELYAQRKKDIKAKGSGVTCFTGSSGEFYFENDKVIVAGNYLAQTGTETIALYRNPSGQTVSLTFKNIEIHVWKIDRDACLWNDQYRR